MTASEHKWIRDLKPGDVVIVAVHGVSGHSRALRKVLRVNKKSVTMEEGDRFTLEGVEIGGSQWYKNTLVRPTPKRIEEVKDKNLARSLSHFMERKVQWSKVPLTVLKNIYGQVKDFVNKEK